MPIFHLKQPSITISKRQTRWDLMYPKGTFLKSEINIKVIYERVKNNLIVNIYRQLTSWYIHSKNKIQIRFKRSQILVMQHKKKKKITPQMKSSISRNQIENKIKINKLPKSNLRLRNLDSTSTTKLQVQIDEKMKTLKGIPTTDYDQVRSKTQHRI